MFDSINRMEGTTVDWSQMSSIKKQTAGEDNLALSSTVKSKHSAQEQESSILEGNREKLYKELEKANNQFEVFNHSMRMKFNEDAERFYVEVFNSRTQEVIDSIPAEHVLELAAKLKDMVGFFIDEKR